MNLRRGVACLLFLLSWAVRASGQDVPAGPVFDVQPLAPGVYAAVVVASPPVYAFANSLVVIGDDGVLVVDTQASSAAARALIAAIRELTDAPVRWVVNTHWHGDHVYGNAAYREEFPAVEFLGHSTLAADFARTAAGLERERAELPGIVAQREEALRSRTGPDGAPLSPDEVMRLRRSLALNRAQIDELRSMELIPPTRTIDRELDLVVGERRVRILHFGPAHTAGDVVVYLPEAGIAAVGDLLEGAFPYAADGDPAGWAAVLEAVGALTVRVILPGRGSVQRDGRLLDLQRRLFEEASVAAHGQACGDNSTGATSSTGLAAVREEFEVLLGISASRFDTSFAEVVDRALEVSAFDCATPQRLTGSR